MLRIHVNLSKGQTREMPEIEHARSNLAKKIKDSGIYQYIVRYGRIANKYYIFGSLLPLQYVALPC